MKFEEILVAITLFTGIIYLLDNIFFKRRRMVRNGIGYRSEPMLVEYSKAFFPVLLVVLILRSFVVEPFKIPSASMRPTLIEGDHILVNKFTYGIRLPVLGYKLVENNKPKRGDVIVFRHADHKDLIKRVVGLPGDHINYQDKVLFINGTPVHLAGKDMIKTGDFTVAYKQIETLENQPLGNETNNIEHSIITEPTQISQSYDYNNFKVPENSYFVMGDNRDHSADSRYWGAVPDSAIIGRAFAIWWNWDLLSLSDLLHFWQVHIIWERIGTAIQ